MRTRIIHAIAISPLGATAARAPTFGIGGADPGFKQITLETRVTTTAPGVKVNGQPVSL